MDYFNNKKYNCKLKIADAGVFTVGNTSKDLLQHFVTAYYSVRRTFCKEDIL